jgi:hypothetical protein
MSLWGRGAESMRKVDGLSLIFIDFIFQRSHPVLIALRPRCSFLRTEPRTNTGHFYELYLILNLFNDVVSTQNIQRRMTGREWIINPKGSRRKRLWPGLRYYPSVCLEGTIKTTNNIQNFRVLPPKFEPDPTNKSLKCYRLVLASFLYLLV